MDIFERHDINCVLYAGANIIVRKVGKVIFRDLLESYALAHEFQHILNRNASACNNRFSEVSFSGCVNSFRDGIAHMNIIPPTN